MGRRLSVWVGKHAVELCCEFVKGLWGGVVVVEDSVDPLGCPWAILTEIAEQSIYNPFAKHMQEELQGNPLPEHWELCGNLLYFQGQTYVVGRKILYYPACPYTTALGPLPYHFP